MEVSAAACLHYPNKPFGGHSVAATSNEVVMFSPPIELTDAGFPASETNFNVEKVMSDCNSGNKITTGLLSDVAKRFSQKSNSVVFAYGERATPKRQLMFGSSSGGVNGYAAEIITAALSSPMPDSVYKLSCFAMNNTENVVDLLDLKNTEGIIADSVKEGPRVRNVEKVSLPSAAQVASVMQTIVRNYEEHFARVLPEKFASPEEDALPPYNCDTIMCTLYRYTSGDQNVECNSLTFVCLADSERPVLCGIDVQQLSNYEKTHKTLASVVSIMGSIRCNRLRIPYGKSKLTALLKRACNAEKNNVYNDANAPTKCFMVAHVFTDHGHAEEAFHTLTMLKRLLSVMGGGGIGPATRDLALEKWRLEQDIVELKDELTIARAVHDYKPCIYDQPKPVQNIAEAEQQRIAAIQKRREDAKERAQQEIRAKAQAEAKQIIEEQEKQSNRNLKELEQRLADMRAENQALQAERSQKTKEYERHLEKIRKKKEGEETQIAKLKEEISGLEEDLKARQEQIDRKRKQLEVSTMDQAKGREAILQERERIKEQRAALYQERRQQREQWLQQIKETNEKVLQQVRLLVKERESKKQRDSGLDDDADETEETVRSDIESINNYLPKLISLDEVPADLDAAESVRKQLEEYFVQEAETYAAKLEQERERKQKLESAVEVYKGRLSEQQSKQKQEHMADAMRKEAHLASLVDQVIQYLQHGLRMTKISSTGNLRRRFFFLSDDCKRIHACELDAAGMAQNRKRPTVTVYIKDIKRVILGMYTPSFTNFATESVLAKGREEAMRNDGSFVADPTPALSAQNLGKFNYRSFGFVLRGGKTLEMVCDTDSDCEAWLVALRRILCIKTDRELAIDHKNGVQAAVPLAEMGWGAPLHVSKRPAFEKLNMEEQQFCGENHIPPQLFFNCKKDLEEKSQNQLVTIYDVRVSSTLDLVRSQHLYEFLVAHKIIPGV